MVDIDRLPFPVQAWLLGVVIAILIWRTARSGRKDRLERKRVDPQRRAILRLGGALTLGFIALGGRLLQITVTDADRIENRTGRDDDGNVLSNPRTIDAALTERRGRILDRNGEVLAESEQVGGVWRRRYPVPEAAHVLGYFSPLRYGAAGTELASNDDLSGRAPRTLPELIDYAVFNEQLAGHDVHLTIDLSLQRLAGAMLDGMTGSAMLMEVVTGRILAMASSPAYDPSALNAVDNESVEAAESAWADLSANNGRPLLFRATSGLYPPGSTFKVVTAAAAIDAGVVNTDTVFEDDGSLEVDGRVIPEFNRPDESQSMWTVRDGLAYSLNVVYAQIGLELGADRMREYGSRFGLGTSTPFHLDTARGQLANAAADLDRPTALADTAFGQGALLVTPLQMALVIAAIANNGAMMKPLLVDSVRRDGESIWLPRQERWKRPISRASAERMRSMLYDSVAYGYASEAAIEGLTVGAKTGTAESGRDAPHGWFIGFAGADSPELAVAVCLDYGGEGGGRPLQIGRELLAAATSP